MKPEIVKARILRGQGKTYQEITQILGQKIPKSTLAYWFKDIELPAAYYTDQKRKNFQHLKSARQRALERNKQIRDQRLAELQANAEKIIRRVTSESLKLALAMLYLGEGAKWQSHRGLMLGSSDPTIIRLYLNLLRQGYQIPSSEIRLRISYRADQKLTELETYWSAVTGVPRDHFYKTIPDPRTVGKETRRKDYRGVCVVYCRGTQIQLELSLIAHALLTKVMGQ